MNNKRKMKKKKKETETWVKLVGLGEAGLDGGQREPAHLGCLSP
jgi:hypothetical protein